MAWQLEAVWGSGTYGAAGGGRSILFDVPSYQASLGLPDGGGRSVPDVTLIAGYPGVAVSSTEPPGALEPVYGTSVASPLSAGFFGLVASRLGCRLGDVHAALYALGTAQLDGGPSVFHDVWYGDLTVGAVKGPSAVAGFDSASGWGSLDVAALAAALPPCPALADGGVVVPLPDDPSLFVDACSFLGCDAGECRSVSDGPSACSPRCDVNTGRGCPVRTVCNRHTVYASGASGSCVPGCDADADCALAPGTVCSRCAHVCVQPGLDGARIGDACTAAADCPDGAYCETGRGLTDGYCTQPCSTSATAGTSCSCPGATECARVGVSTQTPLCVGICGQVGQSCGRDGYLCQPQSRGEPACLPACSINDSSGTAVDSCKTMGTSLACDVASGICGGPPSAVDAGHGAVQRVPAESPVLGARVKVCGCETAEVVPLAWVVVIALARGHGWGQSRGSKAP